MAKTAEQTAVEVARLGEALARIRLEQLWTWGQLAAQAGVSVRVLYRLTQNDDYKPAPLTLARLQRLVAQHPAKREELAS